MYHLFIIFIFTFLFPLSVQASVVINEIAWMGGVNSANHEWIELYNSNNDAVVVDGWVLSDGMNLNINLAGSIPALSYVVLERSSEESSSASAFLIYTGALVNTGATLTLKNLNGDIMDQVVGGEDWQEVGGDNTNKDTAQYTTQGWVTDTPTPKAQNKNGRIEPVFIEEKNETKSSKKNTTDNKFLIPEKNVKSLSLVTTNSVLNMKADMQDVAYVNQSIPFKIESAGVGKTIIDSLVYTWNFGDSYSTTGKEVKHTYFYPGTYVVTVNAKYARYDETIRQEITVLPVSFSITKNEFGDIQIQNDSPYDVDMSDFVVKGEEEVIFPPKTIILPKSTITISKERLGLTKQEKLVSLYDVKGNIVASNFDRLFTKTPLYDENNILVSEDVIVDVFPPKTIILPKSTIIEKPDFLINLTDEALANEEILEEDLFMSTSGSQLNTSLKNKNSENTERWPYVVFICLIILSLFGIYISRRA